jgi:foldase protein PrsA
MKIFWSILFILLSSATGLFAEDFAAKVNGEIISIKEFNQLFNSAKDQLASREKIDFSSEDGQALLAATRRSILDEMIDAVILKQGAQQLGVTVSAQEIEERIQKVQKDFPSKSTFSEALSEDDISPEDLRHGIAQEILTEKIAEKVAGNTKVNDNEIEAFFNKNKELFSQPNRFQLYQLLVATEKEAQDIINKFKKGADFSGLAAKYSLDPLTRSNGGELGFLEEDKLPAHIAPLLSELKPKSILPPIKSAEGYYVVYCGEVLDKKETDVRSAKEQIRNFLVQEKKRATYERWFEHEKDKANVEIDQTLFIKDPPKTPIKDNNTKEPAMPPKASGNRSSPAQPPLT